MERLRAFLRTSEGVMALVIAMYVVKVLAKVGFGQAMHSPMIEGDGWHNGSDIFQALLVIVGVRIALRPASTLYPLGLRGLDALGTLAIGLTLGYAAIGEVLIPSLAALWGLATGTGMEASRSGLTTLTGTVVGAGLMFGSAALSWFVSRQQIRVGRETGHASVVADGEETQGDGKIEALAGVGIVFQALTHWVWVEYVLGLLVCGIMLHTAWEILSTALAMLLNKGLGESRERQLRQMVEKVFGVDSVRRLVTYRRGPCSVVEVDVETRVASSGRDLIVEAIIHRLTSALLEEEGGETSVIVHCVEPDPCPFRIAYLVAQRRGETCAVGTLVETTHLLVAEVEHGAVSSWEAWPVDRDSLAGLIANKRVLCLYVRTDDPDFVEVRPLVGPEVGLKHAPASSLELLGLPA